MLHHYIVVVNQFMYDYALSTSSEKESHRERLTYKVTQRKI